MDITTDIIPQWKRELILRIRSKSKWPSVVQQQLLAGTSRNTSVAIGHTGQQPSLTCSSVAVPVVNSCEDCSLKCNENSSTCSTKMVKERVLSDHNQFNDYQTKDVIENGDSRSVDSSSSEELHYGPGIVNKLKNRYLSLALRENTIKRRPSILNLRKATSLENLLDDDLPNGKPAVTNSRTYQSRWKENNTRIPTNRYNISRIGDLKRARSVEAISRSDDQNEPLLNGVRSKHESLHEDMLIVTEGSDKRSGKMYDNKILELTEAKPFSNDLPHIINRPKRITPIMSEKEKPPVDVVKQTKRIFEGKAEQRTKPPHQTGDVAAKVATYKNIIGQTRNNKKPPILKQKPDIGKKYGSPERKLQKPCKLPLVPSENGWKNDEKQFSPDVAPMQISSPIPDVSQITSPSREDSYGNHNFKNGLNLSETPDLILHSSPLKSVSSPTFKISVTDNFIKAEINHSNTNNFKLKLNQEFEEKQFSPTAITNKATSPTKEENNIAKTISPESGNNIRKAGSSVTYHLSNSSDTRSHLPLVNKEVRTNSKNHQPTLNTHKLKPVDKTAINSQLSSNSVSKPLLSSPTNLTPQEITKNSINTAKSLEQSVILSSPLSVKCEIVKKVEVPKTTLPRETKDQNSIVFKFTDRKDVPDYVGNDGRICTGKIEKPKVSSSRSFLCM